MFVLYVIALINIFASYTVSYDPCEGFEGASLDACRATGIGSSSYGTGPGFGIWVCVVLSLALIYFLALSAQKKGHKLPVSVPGPKL